MPADFPPELKRDLHALLLPWLGDQRKEVRRHCSARTAATVAWLDGVSASALGDDLLVKAGISDVLAVLQGLHGIEGSNDVIASLDAAIARVQACIPRAAQASVDPESAFCHAALRRGADKRYQVDSRFVRLNILRDMGPEAQGGRFVQDAARTFTDLRALLEAVEDPCVVLLGAPGGGKSTLLQRLSYDSALNALNAPSSRLPWVVPLNDYPADENDPHDWLAKRWAREHPGMPPFDTLLADGRMLLLLDALNELKRRSDDDLFVRIDQWRAFLPELAEQQNRAVITCRSLDYSLPLTNQGVAAQQATVQALNPSQIEAFLHAHVPLRAAVLWAGLRDDAAQLELYGTPYFLKLLTELAPEQAADAVLPHGRVALFTGFVRTALRREVEKRNLILLLPALLTPDDRVQITTNKYSGFQLPERGALLPGLRALAFGMQRAWLHGEAAQVRVPKREALVLIGGPHAEAVLAGGVAINLLDVRPEEDDAVLFTHQLLQEYFAARQFVLQPEYARVTIAWRADAVRPSLAETLAALDSNTPLPPLASTGWEETVRMAVALAPDVVAAAEAVAVVNLPLAGMALAATRVSDDVKRQFAVRLISRMHDASADLRARIAAGLAAGQLGDPRFTRGTGPNGEAFLLPPWVEIPAGSYVIGVNKGEYDDERPATSVTLAAFTLSKFHVTNGEYALFIKAGGYDDPRWWDTPAARHWQLHGGAEGARKTKRRFISILRNLDEDKIRQLERDNRATSDQVAQWLRQRAWTSEQVDTWLDEVIPSRGRETEPYEWRDARFRAPNQPVVGVCWYEARAYCNWLQATIDLPIQLPSEAQLEAAARGTKGRAYAYGTKFDAARSNTFESHIRATTPVGLYRLGETPEGLADGSGNVWTWTSSAYLPYPYEATDARESPMVDAEKHTLRGGSWHDLQYDAHAACRNRFGPDNRNFNFGFRLSAPLSLGTQ